jgi:arylsulfatase A-like enzyme
MVEQMDRGIGRIVGALTSTGQLEHTIVVFLSDNGACAEEVPLVGLTMERFLARTHIVRSTTRDGRPVRVGNDPSIVPGAEDTYASYGVGWANVSNTPFRLFKRWTHEGGIASPFVLRYPNGGIPAGSLMRTPYQIASLGGTLLELAGVPSEGFAVQMAGPEPTPTMTAALKGERPDTAPLYWEHTGNTAIRTEEWKLVAKYKEPWELYRFPTDPVEEHDLAAEHPEVVKDLTARWKVWAAEVGVIPFADIVDGYVARGATELDAG